MLPHWKRIKGNWVFSIGGHSYIKSSIYGGGSVLRDYMGHKEGEVITNRDVTLKLCYVIYFVMCFVIQNHFVSNRGIFEDNKN